MDVNERHFWQFASQLVIPTKEEGDIRFDKPMGTQRYFIRKVFEGLKDDVHTFICLKGRQQGISTVMLALDLYWIFMHPGIMGSLVAQDELTRDDFKNKLNMYYASLPKQFRRGQEINNRSMFTFNNKSGFIYQIAGSRSGKNMGKGKALTFLHGTEISSWAIGEAGLASLQASLAQEHPFRLFVYESTAEGYDMFHDMYDSAAKSVTERALFIPWWMNERYSVKPDSNVFKTYWGKPCARELVIKQLEANELEWYRAVRRMYKYELTCEQMAWWRWQFFEKFSEDIDMLMQNHPPTAEHAFRLTGSQFYPSSALNDLMTVARERQFIPYIVTFGARFEDTKIAPCRAQQANLRIFLAPVDGAMQRKAFYTLGADPAYGSSDWKDGFVVHIDRVYGDFIEQAAEFYSTGCTTVQFAWVIAMLAGYYENTRVNLELNGPGKVVLQELDQLKKIAGASREEGGRKLSDFLRNVRHYNYMKYNGSLMTNNVRHFITTTDTKETLMNSHRDSVVRGMVDVSSVDLVEEMKMIVRDGSFIGADGKNKDDRVIAAALSHIAWAQNLKLRLIQGGISKGKAVQQEKEQEEGANPVRQVFNKYMKEHGLTR